MAKSMGDIGLNTAGTDLVFANGDLTVVESTREHQRQLLINDKGDFKEHPTICVGVFGFIDDETLNSLARTASIEFIQDGMTVNKMQLQGDGTLNIDANY